MRQHLLVPGLVLSSLFVYGLGAAQVTPQPMRAMPGSVANWADVYCSGIVTPEAVPYDTYIISGEEARPTTIYAQHNYVYINKGASQGVKVGDEYQIIRPMKDATPFEWFDGQAHILKAMGQQWRDLGSVKVVVAGKDVATALVVNSCEHLERGDYARPAVARVAPTLKALEQFDRFAPPTGKANGLVVVSKEFSSTLGQNDVLYINLGSNQGTKTNDYVRFFRYQGAPKEFVYQLPHMQHRIFGFGKTPKPYAPTDLPREVLGEGVVLRSSPTSSTVLVMNSIREIYVGDWVEIEPDAPAAMRLSRPPVITCVVEHSPIQRGRHARIIATANDPEGFPLTYTWQASGGKIVGTEESADFDSGGMAEGSYTIIAHADNGRGGVADCSAVVEVQAPPAPEPVAAVQVQASKTAECDYRASGSSRADNVCKRVLDDVGLRLKNDPNSSIVIVGFADPGEPQSAQLAQSRANMAQKYLADSGIDPSRVVVRVGQADTAAGAQNRRVDIVWVPKGATY